MQIFFEKFSYFDDIRTHLDPSIEIRKQYGRFVDYVFRALIFSVLFLLFSTRFSVDKKSLHCKVYGCYWTLLSDLSSSRRALRLV